MYETFRMPSRVSLNLKLRLNENKRAWAVSVAQPVPFLFVSDIESRPVAVKATEIAAGYIDSGRIQYRIIDGFEQPA